MFGIGPAGTGKTYLAMAKAVQALQAKQVNRIILTRPAVEAGERLGFLPGTLTDKIDPYLRPLYDALHDMLDPDSIPRLMAAGTIEVAPLAYMRGRTLNDAFIILDEAQNTSAEQMKMFLTRLGFGSQMVVTGDVTQVDLPSGTTSGLRVVQDILEGIEDVHFSRLTSSDVVRHRLVGEIVDAYGRWDESHRSPATARRRAGAPPVSVEVVDESRLTDPSAPGAAASTAVEVAALARHVLDEMRVHPLAELSVLLVDTEAMARLHVQWMDEPGPTDVMSFPMDELRPGREDGPARPACWATSCCAPRWPRAGRAAGHATAEEVLLLATHGILHLLGFDHAEPDEEREMFALQRRLLLGFLALGSPATTPSPDAAAPWLAVAALLLSSSRWPDALAAAEAALSPPDPRRSAPRPGRRRPPRGTRRARRRGRTRRPPCSRSPRCCASSCETLAAVCVRAGRRRPWCPTWWPALLAAVVMGGGRASSSSASARAPSGRQHAETVALRRGARLLPAHPPRWGRWRAAWSRSATPSPPGRGLRDGPFGSEAELREIVDLAGETAVIEAGERGMIHSVFELGDTLVREVMVPRTDMVGHRRGTPGLHEAWRCFLRSGFSRVPVVGETPTTSWASSTSRTSPGCFHADPAAARADARRRPCARRRSSSPRACRWTTCCGRCSATPRTWRSSSTSTAAPPGW